MFREGSRLGSVWTSMSTITCTSMAGWVASLPTSPWLRHTSGFTGAKKDLEHVVILITFRKEIIFNYIIRSEKNRYAKYVNVRVQSSRKDLCAMISVQSLRCPIYDLESDAKYHRLLKKYNDFVLSDS